MTALDPSPIVPIRAVDELRRSGRASVLAGSAAVTVSLVFNLAIVTFLAQWAFPRELPQAEQHAIAVEIVEDAPKPDKPSDAGSKPVATPPPSISTQKKAETSPSTPAPSSPPATPSTSPPAYSPSAPADEKGSSSSSQANKDGAEPERLPVPDTPPQKEPGAPDDKPHLVAAPPDPRQAAQQADKNVAANAETEQATSAKPSERPPPQTPEILAAPGGSETLPAPVRSTDPKAQPAPPSAEEQREAENTAKLAAALPFSQLSVPSLARAALTGTGASAGEYRGAVYGSFRKADDLIEAAQARHLHGQAVVVFSIDDAGALTSIKIGVSSGDAAVDQTALDIIRRSAPFPPPPPGAQKTFSPAIRLGPDE